MASFSSAPRAGCDSHSSRCLIHHVKEHRLREPDPRRIRAAPDGAHVGISRAGGTGKTRHSAIRCTTSVRPRAGVKQQTFDDIQLKAKLQFGPACGVEPVDASTGGRTKWLQFSPACGVQHRIAKIFRATGILQFGPASRVKLSGRLGNRLGELLQFGPVRRVKPEHSRWSIIPALLQFGPVRRVKPRCPAAPISGLGGVSSAPCAG